MNPASFKAVSIELSNVFWKKINTEFIPEKYNCSVFIADIRDFSEKQFSECLSVISEKEQIQSAAFFHLQHKKQYVLSHILLRLILAKYLHVPADQIVYDYTQNKKPFIKNPSSTVLFNISHAGNKILIGLSLKNNIGVDIERFNPDFDINTFASTHFSIGEQKQLNHPEKSKNIENFFRIWTAKEAWLKLTGVGLIDNLATMDSSIHYEEKTGPVYIYSLNFDDYAISIAIDKKSKLHFYQIDNLPLHFEN